MNPKNGMKKRKGQRRGSECKGGITFKSQKHQGGDGRRITAKAESIFGMRLFTFGGMDEEGKRQIIM